MTGLAEALSGFDEAALAVLASKGIVRRALRDVEEGKVRIVEADEAGARVAADGETVRIGPEGPVKADCSCPASGLCRHRIAAVLLLRAGASDLAAPPDDARGALLAEIAALDEADLRRFAGRAGWRAALELAERGVEICVEGASLRLRLADGEAEMLYLPGRGVEGMASKVRPAKRKVAHVAALIAARRAAGIEPETPVSEPPPGSKPLDPAFLAEVRASLAEACRSALSLAPVALEERLFALSVSSRADSMPRLAALLRAIARMVGERRRRSLGFDPETCLSRIAQADAICRALTNAGETRRDGLLGAGRQAYDELGPALLVGLGAETWRSETGARGVAAYFYELEGDRWFTLSLLRAAGVDPGFDPRRAYAQEAVLGGHSLQQLVRSELRFDNLVASPGGRLSSGGDSRPSVAPAAPPTNADWPCVVDDWLALEARLRARLVGTLSAPAPAVEPVLLRPRRTGTPWFDDLGQAFHFPIQDSNGLWTSVSAPHDPACQAGLDALAAAFARMPDFLLLAAAELVGGRYRIRPVTVVRESGIWSIDLDTAPNVGGGGLRALFQRRASGFAPVPPPPSFRLVADLRSELAGLAETGCRADAASSRLRALAARASDHGLATVSRAIAGVLESEPDALPSAVLAAWFVLDELHRRLVRLPLIIPSR